MTPAPEIPADVMAAAQKSALSWFATSEDGIYREPLTYFIAQAILAERQRCVEAVSAQRAVWPHPEHLAARSHDLAINRALAAIQGPAT